MATSFRTKRNARSKESSGSPSTRFLTQEPGVRHRPRRLRICAGQAPRDFNRRPNLPRGRQPRPTRRSSLSPWGSGREPSVAVLDPMSPGTRTSKGICSSYAHAPGDRRTAHPYGSIRGALRPSAVPHIASRSPRSAQAPVSAPWRSRETITYGHPKPAD